MGKLSVSLAAVACLILAACQSSDDDDGLTAVQRGTEGPEVSSICFTREIRGWQELSRSSIILERGRDDYFKLDLAGACDPSDAFLSISVESRSGICLDTGDEINFPEDRAPACNIRRITEWIPGPDL